MDGYRKVDGNPVAVSMCLVVETVMVHKVVETALVLAELYGELNSTCV